MTVPYSVKADRARDDARRLRVAATGYPMRTHRRKTAFLMARQKETYAAVCDRLAAAKMTAHECAYCGLDHEIHGGCFTGKKPSELWAAHG